MAQFKSSWPPPYMSCQGGAVPKEATYFIHQSYHTSRAVIYTEDKVEHTSRFLFVCFKCCFYRCSFSARCPLLHLCKQNLTVPLPNIQTGDDQYVDTFPFFRSRGFPGFCVSGNRSPCGQLRAIYFFFSSQSEVCYLLTHCYSIVMNRLHGCCSRLLRYHFITVLYQAGRKLVCNIAHSLVLFHIAFRLSDCFSSPCRITP